VCSDYKITVTMNMKRTLLSSMAVLNTEGGVLLLLVLVCLPNVRETSYF